MLQLNLILGGYLCNIPGVPQDLTFPILSGFFHNLTLRRYDQTKLQLNLILGGYLCNVPGVPQDLTSPILSGFFHNLTLRRYDQTKLYY